MKTITDKTIYDDDIHLALMKIVERAVRPVRCNTARKRRMRDELLAHLSEIYDEELARSGVPTAAVRGAATRFGDPNELTAELQAAVPRREQLEHQFESWFGWHPPETALQWMTRVALQLGCLMFVLCLSVAIVAMREFGWSYSVWLVVRPLAAAMLVLPICLFSYGVCYYRIRDHYFGAFRAIKSWLMVVVWAALLGLATVASGFVFFMICYGSLAPATAAFYPIVVFGIIWAAGAVVVAPVYGPQEIRDTIWATLDLDEQPLAA